jgi:hypothetical protein
MSEAKRNCSYLASVVDWKMRNMIEGYLRARQLFKSEQGGAKKPRLFAFQTLKEICDILYHVKEDQRLIFRRSDEDRLNRNGNHKFIPAQVETAFLDNVGLLFHKVLVARELRYLLEHYAKDNEMWESHSVALQDNLEKIDKHFDEGVVWILDLMRAHADNVLLIIFLLENGAWVGKCLNMSRAQLLQQIIQEDNYEHAYLRAADYYEQSGWYDKTREVLQKVLKMNPQNAAAREILGRVGGKQQLH